jgi:hypothetical protein
MARIGQGADSDPPMGIPSPDKLGTGTGDPRTNRGASRDGPRLSACAEQPHCDNSKINHPIALLGQLFLLPRHRHQSELLDPRLRTRGTRRSVVLCCC